MFNSEIVKPRKNFLPSATIAEGFFVEELLTDKEDSFGIVFGIKDYESVKVFIYTPSGDSQEVIDRNVLDLTSFIKDLFKVNKLETVFTAADMTALKNIVKARFQSILSMKADKRPMFAAKVTPRKVEKEGRISYFPSIRIKRNTLALDASELSFTEWEKNNYLSNPNEPTPPSSGSTSTFTEGDNLPF